MFIFEWVSGLTLGTVRSCWWLSEWRRGESVHRNLTGETRQLPPLTVCSAFGSHAQSCCSWCIFKQDSLIHHLSAFPAGRNVKKIHCVVCNPEKGWFKSNTVQAIWRRTSTSWAWGFFFPSFLNMLTATVTWFQIEIHFEHQAGYSFWLVVIV